MTPSMVRYHWLKGSGPVESCGPLLVPCAGPGSAYIRERLEEMLEFLTTTSGLFEELVSMPTGTLKGLARMRGKLKLLLGSGKKSPEK